MKNDDIQQPNMYNTPGQNKDDFLDGGHNQSVDAYQRSAQKANNRTTYNFYNNPHQKKTS
jgi:hypothetical protein